MTPRRVSAIGYWFLNAGVWSLWAVVLNATVLGGRNLGSTAMLSFALWFAMGLGLALAVEGKAARKEKRPRATFGTLVDRPVELRAAGWDLATVRRFLGELSWNVVVLGLAGVLGGRGFHLLPWGLPLLVAYGAARLVLPPFADERPHWRPSSGPIPGS